MFSNIKIMPNKNKSMSINKRPRTYKKSIKYINNVGNLRKQRKYSRRNVEINLCINNIKKKQKKSNSNQLLIVNLEWIYLPNALY